MSIFFKLFVILLALAYVSHTAVILNETLDISIPFQEANEQTLLELGEKVNSPLLKLIGFALKNLNCNINGPCDIWSPWTRCSSIAKGTFGLRTRMRSCYQKQSSYDCSDFVGAKTADNQNEVCEGFCPKNYNITSTNLCLRRSMSSMKHRAAELFCEEDGGHIINIDTQERFEAASFFANTRFLWVQGTHTQQAGTWQYKVGGDPESQPFFKWVGGANKLYMAFYKSKFYSFDEYHMETICEIRL